MVTGDHDDDLRSQTARHWKEKCFVSDGMPVPNKVHRGIHYQMCILIHTSEILVYCHSTHIWGLQQLTLVFLTVTDFDRTTFFLKLHKGANLHTSCQNSASNYRHFYKKY